MNAPHKTAELRPARESSPQRPIHTMAERPLLFKDPREVEVRQRFTRECEISIDNFVRLIGKTEFKADDRVRCQTRRPDKHLCGKEFGDGWVALNKDGKEGYVGGFCAKRDFKHSKEFKMETKRVNAFVQLLQYMDVLNKLLADREAYGRRVEALLALTEDVHYRGQGVRDHIPPKILDLLHSRVRTGNGRVSVEYEYVEEQKKGPPKITWAGQTVGTIAGLALIDFKSTLSPKVNAERISKALKDVVIDESAGKKNLQHWSETLGSIDRVEVEAQEAEAHLRRFSREENLRLLLLLTLSPRPREELARYILRRKGAEDATEDGAREYVMQLDASIRAANQNRNFRVR